MEFEIFCVEAQDPFHNFTPVLGRCYYPVKSHFSVFPPLLILNRFRSFYAMKNMQMFQQIVINLEDMKLG